MRLRAAVLAIALTTVLLGAGTAPAAYAVLARAGAGHFVSYQPTRSRAARARSLASAQLAGATTRSSTRRSVASYKPCNGQGACLTYEGGPVMQTTTLTAVFWNPEGSGLSYPSGYKSEIEQFLADVAADSGKESDFFSLLPQYYENSEGKINHVNYSVSAQPAQNDTAALPTGTGEKCTSPFKASRPCVTDPGIRKQLISLIKAHALATGIGHEYLVFFPPGMESCFAESGPEEKVCSGSYYCGYHGSLEAGTPKEVEYANEPDNADPAYGAVCLPEPGLKAGYATVDSTSHEVSESVTDPEVGSEIGGKESLSWYDSHKLYVAPIEEEVEYGEIGDMCAYEYRQGDSALEAFFVEGLFDSDGLPNQTINGHEYLLQLEWDNAHSTCSLSAEAATTEAAFSDNASAPVKTGQPISFDGSSSHGPADEHIANAIETYEWNWGDGAVTSRKSPTAEHAYSNPQASPKTFTVKLTVTDGNGDQASSSQAVEIAGQPPAPTPTPLPVTTPVVTVKTAPTGAVQVAGTVHVTGVKQNKNGTVALSVSAPAAGLLNIREASGAHSSLVSPLTSTITAPAVYPVALSASSKAKMKVKGPFVKAISVNVHSASTVTLQIAPSATGKEFVHKHKLTVKLLITFTPTGGGQTSIVQTVTLALAAKHK